MNTLDVLPRKFKLGALLLDDPKRGAPLSEAVRALSRNFPQFRASRLYEEDGRVVNNTLVYELALPPAKDNG